MNKFYLLVLLAAGSIPVLAQNNITQMEYFFDSDPGYGNGTAISISAGPVINTTLSINTSGLTAGFHVLKIRAREQSGDWGLPESRAVFIALQSITATSAITEMEYFIDTDPGFGNGTAITFGSSSTLNLLENVPTNSLSAGFHVIHFRAKDTDGTWGVRESRAFYVAVNGISTQASISNLEYFVDTDPGYGNGTPITVTSATSLDINALIDTDALAEGFHKLFIRSRDNDGQWGQQESKSFFVDAYTQINELEYFIDTDPGEGNGTNVVFSPPVGEIDHNLSIPTASLAAGSHSIGVRVSRTDGTWGYAKTVNFNLKDTQSITFSVLAAKTFGDAPFTLGASSTSGLAIQYASSDLSVVSISGNTATIVGPGTTTITASQPGDPSYDPALDVQQTLVINKGDQTITFGALASKALGDAPFTVSATSTSGLPAQFASSNLAVATISGNVVTIAGAGTTQITASQSGNTNFNAAADVSRTLTITAPLSPPTIGTGAATPFFTSGEVVVNSTIVVGDPDGFLQSATITISTGFQSAEDQLLFAAQNGIGGSFNSTTGTLVLTGNATTAFYQTALRTVRYTNTSTSPSTTDRVISFQVSDGNTTSGTVTSNIVINKPPTIAAEPQVTQAGGNIVFMVGDILTDPDNNLDLSTLVVVSAHGAKVSISGGIITIDYSSVPDYEGTDELTITICDQGGKCRTENISIEVGAEIEVFNGISANADGANDYMRIRFIPPGTRVTIYNRWGDPVFDMENYDNNDPAKRFEGLNSNGNELTPGTYFYKVTPPEGKQYTGYLVLQR